MNVDFYIYAFINKKTGMPYYIGKGREKRFKQNHGRVSVPKDKTKIVFMEKNLTNLGACALERRYIRWYGRKDIDKNGILLNRQEGGEGGSGPISENTKIKISKTLKDLYINGMKIGFSSEKAREIGKISGRSKSDAKIRAVRNNQTKSLEKIKGSVWMYNLEKRSRVSKNDVQNKIQQGWKVGFKI